MAPNPAKTTRTEAPAAPRILRDSHLGADRYFAPWSRCAAPRRSRRVSRRAARGPSPTSPPRSPRRAGGERGAGGVDDVAGHMAGFWGRPRYRRQHRPDVAPQPRVERGDDPLLRATPSSSKQRAASASAVSSSCWTAARNNASLWRSAGRGLPARCLQTGRSRPSGLAEPVAPEDLRATAGTRACRAPSEKTSLTS